MFYVHPKSKHITVQQSALEQDDDDEDDTRKLGQRTLLN